MTRGIPLLGTFWRLFSTRHQNPLVEYGDLLVFGRRGRWLGRATHYLGLLGAIAVLALAPAPLHLAVGVFEVQDLVGMGVGALLVLTPILAILTVDAVHRRLVNAEYLPDLYMSLLSRQEVAFGMFYVPSRTLWQFHGPPSCALALTIVTWTLREESREGVLPAFLILTVAGLAAFQFLALALQLILVRFTLMLGSGRLRTLPVAAGFGALLWVATALFLSAVRSAVNGVQITMYTGYSPYMSTYSLWAQLQVIVVCFLLVLPLPVFLFRLACRHAGVRVYRSIDEVAWLRESWFAGERVPPWNLRACWRAVGQLRLPGERDGRSRGRWLVESVLLGTMGAWVTGVVANALGQATWFASSAIYDSRPMLGMDVVPTAYGGTFPLNPLTCMLGAALATAWFARQCRSGGSLPAASGAMWVSAIRYTLFPASCLLLVGGVAGISMWGRSNYYEQFQALALAGTFPLSVLAAVAFGAGRRSLVAVLILLLAICVPGQMQPGLEGVRLGPWVDAVRLLALGSVPLALLLWLPSLLQGWFLNLQAGRRWDPRPEESPHPPDAPKSIYVP